jgi:alkylation response protein AidB-like acyl-CoA dehydrogenase
MNSELTEEQRQYTDSLDRYLSDRYTFERRRQIVTSPQGWSPQIWTQLAELGVLALPFSSDLGGLDGSPIDTMITMEAFGKALVVEPYLHSIVLAGALLRHGGSDAQKQEHISRLIAGDALYTVAYVEPASRFNLSRVSVQAIYSQNGYRLLGRKCVVYAAPGAQGFLVSARTSGDVASPEGISIFYVASDAAGLRLREYATTDGMRAAEIELDNVFVSADNLVGPLGGGLPLLERCIDEATAAVCAEAVGAMRAVTARTLDYCRSRIVFGQPIGKFQVVQHRLVDMHTAIEQAASLTRHATMHLDGLPAVRARAVSAAKALVGKESRFIAQNSLQLHGAMGMTDELDVSHYFKRLTVIDSLFGNVAFHTRRYANIALLGKGAA